MVPSVRTLLARWCSLLAGYQAITEWLDHEQPAKSEHHRANKVLTDGTITAIKRRAFYTLAA